MWSVSESCRERNSLSGAQFFRLSDYQSFMKYVKVLILGVETGLLRSSRLGVLLVVPSRAAVIEFFSFISSKFFIK